MDQVSKLPKVDEKNDADSKRLRLYATFFRILKISARAALLGYSLRSGITIVLKLLRAFRSEVLKSEQSLRFGALFGTFVFLWKGTNEVLRQYFGKLHPSSGFISGAVAGLSLLAETQSNRVAYSQQLMVRGLQCIVNYLAVKKKWKFPHGDALLFIIANAQVMYAYVLHPTTLQQSFYNFIQTTGPIPESVLKTLRLQIRGNKVSPERIKELISTYNGSELACASGLEKYENLKRLPCEVLHSAEPICTRQSMKVFLRVLLKGLPVYISLNIVPMVLLKFSEFTKKPALLTFVYYVAGFLSSFSIFIEDPRRRAELAMYVLPRGADSLYRVLYNKKLINYVKYFDVLMFSVSTSILIGFFQYEPTMMSPLFLRLVDRTNAVLETGFFQSLKKSKLGSGLGLDKWK
ncbi:hypothetical protein HK098_002885 [Nowakowskiella sp. JEL0407]|nr:hypothetical protein HK098_002885 [Nowakowskiella sp. JEL0407]